MTKYNTADICDQYDVLIADPIFNLYGGNSNFSGKIRTVIAVNDNSFVRELLEEKVDGHVMVVDGKGSMKCALLGDNLAAKAFENGWSGFIINGCIRDSAIINKISIGVKALNTVPNKSIKNNVGEYGTDIMIANATFKEGEFVYSDEDGIVISKTELLKK
mgnify:FL=1|tara:strand:- start:1102 stop:1584 length:483 start_codon:yes stop_codon:yes gene_type:complete